MKLWAALFPLGAIALWAAGCQLEHAGILPTTDGGRGEGGLDGGGFDTGPRPVTWCTTAPNDGHDFCADFDLLTAISDRTPGGFCDFGGLENNCVTSTNGGSVGLDKMLSSSPPNSMVSTLPSAAAGSVQAFLLRPFGGPVKTLTYSFDLRFDALGAGTVNIGEINLGDNGHRMVLRVGNGTVDGGSPVAALGVAEIPTSSPPGSRLIGILPIGKFARISMLVESGPNRVSVSIDGMNSGTLAVDATGDTSTRAISLGLTGTASTSEWLAHFDNVTFDYR